MTDLRNRVDAAARQTRLDRVIAAVSPALASKRVKARVDHEIRLAMAQRAAERFTAWEAETKDIDLSTARIAGRATKENPNKEDATWWYQQGSKWVDNYISWRKNNKDWKIWTTPQGVRAIELELNPIVADVPVKMFIDRIFQY